ncbi:Cullin protein neddylation domain containing protein, putative [Leishmania lindenbergi]|uniref:Cullin protein neddylation domain containing protein n=1 Tax=Leishmania lindenbergi TaxID=651832 RepID=A0AAW3A3B6_9TRYP
MRFGTDFTEEELAELKKLDIIYDKLLPKRSSECKDASTSITNGPGDYGRIPLRDFFVSSAGTPSVARIGSSPPGIAAKWQMMLREMNGEMVVRNGQNIRNTRAVTNRILSWSITFQQADRAAAAVSLGHDGGRALAREWVRGIVVYFQERMDKSFAELNITAQEEAFVRELKLPEMDGADLVSRCVEAARTVITPMLTMSPYFISIVRCCREMVLALKVVQGLLSHISSHTRLMPPTTVAITPNGRRNVLSILTLGEDFLESLRTPLWLFRSVLLFLGALELQQSPKREIAISEQHLDHSIHCIASLVAEVESKRDGSTTANLEVRTILDALVLGHVKNACLSRFPPSKMLKLLEHEQGVLADVAAPDVANNLFARCGPVLKQLLIDYPTFMESTAKFVERNEMSDWGTSLMLVQLFCWDVKTPPDLATQAKQPVLYHVPKMTGPFPHGSTVLSAMVREVLRPLLSVLLSGIPSGAKDDGASGDATGTEIDTRTSDQRAVANPSHPSTAGGCDAPLLLSPFEQKVCATLLTLAAWLQSLSFPTGPRMPKWASLDVGDQIMREFNLGEGCFKSVLGEVLHDVIAGALGQVENNCSHRSATGAAAAPETDDTASQLSTAVLQYLRRVECVWNAVTEHSLELCPSAFSDILALGAQIPSSISTASAFHTTADANATAVRASYNTGLFGDCKYLFYDTVQNVMKTRWPNRYADLLTDPLLHSVHVYLLRAESTSQRSGGLRPVSPSVAQGRPIGAKRPKPLPEQASKEPASHPVSPGSAAAPARGSPPGAAEQSTVVLTSKEELHSALRMVRCIKNRDLFVSRYTVTVRERLLTRPAPDVISDAELQSNKKRHEQEAMQFLAAWLGDASLLKPVRELHMSYSAQSELFKPASKGPVEATEVPTKGIRLTTTILDWRLWGDKEAAPATAPGQAGESGAAPSPFPMSAVELVARAGQALSMATSATAALPFPNDALVQLEKVELAYNEKHSNRMLRWDWNDHAYTTFTLSYPKEGGRVTTIHSTLLLQRLFLAIAAYGRTGVELATLAKRAGMDERRIAAILRLCLDRDKLLVRISNSCDGVGAEAASGKVCIALNYDYTRPPSRLRGEFTYWPNAERRRVVPGTMDQDATITKRRNMIKTSIMQVMKHGQRIKHDELYNTVREKNSKVFDVTVRNFKQEIEGLIGQDFMARSGTNSNEYVFRA